MTFTRRRKRALRSLVFVMIAAVAQWLGLLLLSSSGVMERLLGGGGDLIGLFFAALFMIFRIFVYLVCPGMAVAAVVTFFWPEAKTKASDEADALQRTSS